MTNAAAQLIIRLFGTPEIHVNGASLLTKYHNAIFDVLMTPYPYTLACDRIKFTGNELCR